MANSLVGCIPSGGSSVRDRMTTPHVAQRYLRLGATSIFASSLLLLIYLLWNVEFSRSWFPEQIDDLIMVGSVVFGFYTAVNLRRSARKTIEADRCRKVAEEDALRHRQWLSALVRQMPVGVAVVAKAHGEIVLTNDHFDNMFKSIGDDIEDLKHRNLNISYRDGTPIEIKNLPSQRALFQGESTSNEEIQVERVDGSRVWLAVSAAPVKNPIGLDPSAIITFSDITERKNAEVERAALIRGVLHAQETERLRIARELHDELGQDLVGLSVSLKALEHLVAGAKERHLIATLRETVSAMNAHVHHLTSAMRPLMLEHFGLRRAVEDMAFTWSDRLGIPVEQNFEGSLEDTGSDIAIVAYRIIQEAFTNIAKHANAASATITLRATSDSLHIVVQDDGEGFDTGMLRQNPPRDRFGLAGMAERVSSVGGSVAIESHSGGGTKIHAALPLNMKARAA